jgi:hypothetical protein
VAVEITPADFDDMHHALGRPDAVGARAKTYRNYYCIPVGSITAERFEALGVWSLARTINDGKDAIYCVTPDGRAALADWLERHAPSESK